MIDDLFEAKKKRFVSFVKGGKVVTKDLEKVKELIKDGKLKPEFSKENKFVKVTDKIREEIKKDKAGKGKYPKIAIPPNWKDAKINTNKAAKVWATGIEVNVTGNENERKIYNPVHREYSNVKKHKRVKKFNGDKSSDGRSKILVDLRGKMLKGKGSEAHAAGVLYITGMTGQRIGSKKDTMVQMYKTIETKEKTKKGKPKKERIKDKIENTFGLSSLQARHIKVKGNTVTWNYCGKSGVCQKHSITERFIASFYKNVLKGKKGKDRIHPPTTYMKAFRLMKKFGGVKIKDFRTAKAHEVGEDKRKEGIKKFGYPSTAKEVKTLQKWILQEVSNILGNKPGEVKKSYINPKTLEFDI